LEIAHTRVLNELRRRRRHPGDGAVAVEDFAAAGEDAPETAAWHAQRQRVLNAALAELPPAEGQALRLAFFEELSHTEVAAFLRTPLGTVKTRIRSGLARLFQRLTPVLGPTLLVLALAAAGLWSLRGELSREDRALRMLSLSDSQLLHLGAAEAAASETHGSFRWHPGLSTAVVTLSHAPQPSSGVHFWAWADIGGHWIALCELTPDATGRAIAIAENPALGELPRQIAITAEQMPGSEPSAQRIVGWTGP
jgi:RNA polymerase sigma-70 factor (ECF subfamily)